MRTQKKKTNIWKVLFLSLSGILASVLIALWVLIGSPRDVTIPESSKTSSEETILTVQSNKENLNRLINQTIEKYQKENSYDYQVVLADDVEFYTKIPVFSSEIQMKMTFTPIPLESGDIVLKQQTMELGRMKLPVSYVLNFVKKQDNMPEWIYINPKKEQIHIALDAIEIPEGMKLRADTFDLEKDDISFRLVIPD